MLRCSASLGIREIQIKVTSCLLGYVKRLQSKRPTIVGIAMDVEEWEPSYGTGGNMKWHSHAEKQSRSSSEDST